jgi:hypothetical protein
MDLPRAELRRHGLGALRAAIATRRYRMGAWLRPRAAPLAITALATLCMLAGLDLIAHDFRRMRERSQHAPRPQVIYVMSMTDRGPIELIPVELAPAPLAAPVDVPDVCERADDTVAR